MCRENTQSKNQKMEEQWFYKNVQCMIVISKILSNSKKLEDY